MKVTRLEKIQIYTIVTTIAFFTGITYPFIKLGSFISKQLNNFLDKEVEVKDNKFNREVYDELRRLKNELPRTSRRN